jgi:hypothetical protein
MKITREILKKAQEGMMACERTGKNAWIQMRFNDERNVDYIVEKGNHYFCGQNENAYVYWENGSSYGFTFSPNIFEDNKNEKKD